MMMHVPLRPQWTCTGCGAPWPCPTRRRQLLAEYESASASLGLLMSLYFHDAICELPAGAEGEVYRRFFGWLRGENS
jgi:hypothetical protein